MGNSPLRLQDICKNCESKESDDFMNMTDFYVEDYEEIIRYQKPINIDYDENKKEAVTIMDLFNIPFEKDEEIKTFIIDRIGIDINTEKGIKEINNLINNAIELYENRYLRSLPTKIKKVKFSRAESIINFIKETKTNKRKGALNCAIAKIAYAIDDVISNPRIKRSGFLDREFVESYLEKPFQIEKEYIDEKTGDIYMIGKVTINGKIIIFKMISRQKGSNSIIGKEIADPTYYSVDRFKDLVGATFYVDQKEDAILLMQYIDQMIYEGNSKIKNKNAIKLSDINENLGLNKGFYNKIISEIRKKAKEDIKKTDEEIDHENLKKGTNEKYQEIKLVGYVDLALEKGERAYRESIGTEIKFVIGGHDNESGLALHCIYDYIKRFRELTRLGLPIRKIDIVRYVNNFFENIDNILKKKNKEKDIYYMELFQDLKNNGFIQDDLTINGNIEKNEKILALGLYKYFESKLVRVKIANSKKIYLFDERIIKLTKGGLYKEIYTED